MSPPTRAPTRSDPTARRCGISVSKVDSFQSKGGDKRYGKVFKMRWRDLLAAMGIERVEGVKDPEDHIASLFDIMSGLIRGAFDAPSDLAAQAEFFKKHIEPWAPLLMQDIEGAKAAVFFAPVGSIGRAFMDIESKAFGMGEAG